VDVIYEPSSSSNNEIDLDNSRQSSVIRESDLRLDGPGNRDKYWDMGDHLPVGKPPQYFPKPPRATQHPTLSGTGNEYQPKCGDALRLEVKGRYGS